MTNIQEIKHMTKSAMITICGRPNVGKSTLLNAILGEKVAIVSKKPQTTRNRITGIHTVGEDQYVFLDTPGMHKPRTKLGDFMVKTANETLGGVDAAILVVEAREEVGDIVISLERAKEQAGEIGHSFLREVAFLTVHSTLNLLGLDHERSPEEDELQCSLQKKIVATMEELLEKADSLI